MEENNQITDNCKVFIEQYIYCKNKAIDKYKKIGTKFDLSECNLFYNLTKECVNSQMNSINI